MHNTRCRPTPAGARCRHNLNYWLFGDYVGIGAGAHGKLSLGRPERILRTTKPKQPREYQEQVRVQRGASVGESAYIAVRGPAVRIHAECTAPE